MNAAKIIKQLDLHPHPEGGYFKETYRCEATTINQNGNTRNICTSIYYMLTDKEKSCFHKIQSDELWFFHAGQCLEIVYIDNNILNTFYLGNQLDKGEQFYVKIPANKWFAAKIKDSKGYTLLSCTVSPGFDFHDFQIAKKKDLLKEYPHLKDSIENFT